MVRNNLPTPLTILPALVIEAAVTIRNRMYDHGLLRSYQLPAPVISIGNLTVGGTGKTPLAIHISELLLDAGYTPALLSRGYGRRDGRASLVVAPGQDVPDAAVTLGDEPAMIRRRVPGVWLGIDPVRFRAGSAILDREPRAVFVLDDGFQHRNLSRSLDLVVVDRLQPLVANHTIPRGTLREPVSSLRRADAAVLNGTRPVGETDEVADSLRLAAPGLRVYQLETTIDALIPFPLWAQGPSRQPTAVPPGRAFLVAAVGNPERFRADVLRLGIDITGERFFRDHTWLGQTAWDECCRRARQSGADCMLTTEKDAIKIEKPPKFPVTVCVQVARVAERVDFANLVRRVAGEEV